MANLAWPRSGYTMGLDFSQLYALLKLEPGCSLEELKHAYRKRVAELHPDRHGNHQAGGEAGNRQLAALTPLYRMALQFHDTHGRLPGSARVDARGGQARPGMRAVPRPPAGTRPGPPAARVSTRNWWLLAALAGLVAYLVFSQPPDGRPRPADPGSRDAVPREAGPRDAGPRDSRRTAPPAR